MPSHVEVLGQTKGWLKYRLPRKFLGKNKTPFKGQKQKWFLLKFLGEDADIKVDRFEDPEFDDAMRECKASLAVFGMEPAAFVKPLQAMQTKSLKDYVGTVMTDVINLPREAVF